MIHLEKTTHKMIGLFANLRRMKNIPLEIKVITDELDSCFDDIQEEFEGEVKELELQLKEAKEESENIELVVKNIQEQAHSLTDLQRIEIITALIYPFGANHTESETVKNFVLKII